MTLGERLAAGDPLRFLWFGSYATGPGYPRTETLVSGLRELGHDVREVHAPLFAGAEDRMAAARGGVSGTAWRQARAAARLASGWFRESDHDVAVVGAGGIVDALLLRFLQNFDRRPLVLDAFIPLYDTVVRDRALAAETSLRARALAALERASGRVADIVLSDTPANAELLAADMRAPRSKFAVVPIAQPDSVPPAPLPPADGSRLRVLLVATFIPLHGVEVVVEAARRLGGDGVEVTIVGKGQMLADVQARAASVPGLELVPQFLPADEIRTRLDTSHVGLGIFGDTAKAARVVPLKAALTLSRRRALVTRSGPAAEAALGTGEGAAALLVPPDDPEALAAALRRLRDDRALLERLATAGRTLYEERYTPRRAAERLLAALAAMG